MTVMKMSENEGDGEEGKREGKDIVGRRKEEMMTLFFGRPEVAFSGSDDLRIYDSEVQYSAVHGGTGALRI